MNRSHSAHRSTRAIASRRSPAESRIEQLESRIAPANITSMMSGTTLMIKGTNDANDLNIASNGNPGEFVLTSPSMTDTIDGTASVLWKHVTSITVHMLGGDDKVALNSASPIVLDGSLTIDGGDGANSASCNGAGSLMVKKNFTITNGKNTTGKDDINLANVSVLGATKVNNGSGDTNTIVERAPDAPPETLGSLSITNGAGNDVIGLNNFSTKGSVTINNGDGDSSTGIGRTAAGFSTILGNFTVNNGAGKDFTFFYDTGIGGNLTVNNGKANLAGEAGFTQFQNSINGSVYARIGGNVSVTYLNGNGTPGQEDGIWDAEVAGNVTFNHGPGKFQTNFDGYKSTLPVVIGGNLTLTGTGQNTIGFGTEFNKSGVEIGKNLTITTGAADDSVTFNKTRVEGNVVISGGDGANAVTTTGLTVTKNLSITNGKNTTGVDTASLSGLTVLGAVTLKNGAGDTNTTITAAGPIGRSISIVNGAGFDNNQLLDASVNGPVTIMNGDGGSSNFIKRTAAGFSNIQGNLTITNGAGEDDNQLRDYNVGGNFKVTNGQGSAGGVAGYTSIYNAQNVGQRSVIGGNVTVSYVDGNTTSLNDGLYDLEVGGNVSFDHGAGASTTHFDAYDTFVPVLVHGNLTLKGSGAAVVDIGTQYNQLGLTVGQNVTLTGGAGADTVTAKPLRVGGVTKLTLGDGANVVNIDDSDFARAFTLTTGKDADIIKIETATGTAAPTFFRGAVAINEGKGNDKITLTGYADANQALYVYSTFVIHSGGEAGDFFSPAANLFFPFFNTIIFIP